jgi:hypothetical protein
MNTMRRNTEALLQAGRFMVVSRHHNVGKYHNLPTVNEYFRNVRKFSSMCKRHQNRIRDEIKSRLNSGNICYDSVQNLLPSRLISENINSVNSQNYDFTCCFAWVCNLISHTKEMVFENRALRVLFGSEREEVAGSWKRLHNEGFHNLFASPNVTVVIKLKRMRWTREIGDIRNANKILVGKPGGNRPAYMAGNY